MGLIAEDWVETPLYRLQATCLRHWGQVLVGEPFKYDNENIRLSPVQETSWEEWDRKYRSNKLAFGFPHYWKLYCKVCGTRTRHIPKGRSRGT